MVDEELRDLGEGLRAHTGETKRLKESFDKPTRAMPTTVASA